MPDAKAMFRDATNIGAFIKEFGYGEGHTFFMTTTFKDNIDKLVCAMAFNVFRTFLNKESVRYAHGLTDAPFHYIAVWEQHKKGGWHLHILGHIDGATTSKLRALIRHFLSVTSTAVGFINVKWTYGHDACGIKKYMTKYLFKDTGKRIKGVRYINYSRNWMRQCCLPFSWFGGQAAMWRKACADMFMNFPHSFKVWYHNVGYHGRSFVLNAWMIGDYASAISKYLSYKFCEMSDLVKEDLRKLEAFVEVYNCPCLDEQDVAIREFLAFDVPGKIEHTSVYSEEDSACIPGLSFV